MVSVEFGRARQTTWASGGEEEKEAGEGAREGGDVRGALVLACGLLGVSLAAAGGRRAGF